MDRVFIEALSLKGKHGVGEHAEVNLVDELGAAGGLDVDLGGSASCGTGGEESEEGKKENGHVRLLGGGMFACEAECVKEL